MLFSTSTYMQRRTALKQKVGSGLLLIFGHNDSPANYPANAYRFRQDSSFLYFFAHDREGLVGVMDIDNDREYLIGNDTDLEDVIWTGKVPSVRELAFEAGIGHSAPMTFLRTLVDKARQAGQTIHYLPPCRHDLMIQIGSLLGMPPLKVRDNASLSLIKAVVDLRAVKSAEEIAEMEKAMSIGYEMHTTAMKACRPGVTERYIGGLIEGIACSHGAGVSFNSIVSMHGEVFHGNPSDRPLEAGRLMLCDAGAETVSHYCSDHTRVVPVSGQFTSRQRDIYSIVEACHDLVIARAQPGVKWIDMHLDVCRLMAERLKDLGLMRGNVEDAVQAGAHAMFFPHGLGHMLGMDCHDMEGLGQIHVGFDDEVRPSTQFGTDCLRCGRRLQPGWVMTDEPGIYFIPALMDKWRGEGLYREFIHYDKLETYRDFGGIRIEDDILITRTGCRVLGEKMIPCRMEDVEHFMAR